MTKRYREDEFYMDLEDESDSIFSSLFDSCEECLECGYEGPLTLRTRGYVCPECDTLVIPNG